MNTESFQQWRNERLGPLRDEAFEHLNRDWNLFPAAFAEHRTPGFYKALSEAQLQAAGYPVPELNILFPAPTDCASWHPAEKAKDGSLFRFFARQAWLAVHRPDGATTIQIEIRHPVNAKVETGLHMQAREAGSGKVFAEKRGPGMWEINEFPTPSFWLVFSCNEQAVPAALYPDSKDQRLLSAAVVQPKWL